MSICLANAQLVLSDHILTGSVTFSGEEISTVTPGTQVPAGAIDCEGDYVSPGLVELHTDNLERHMQPRPGVRWPHNAAILAHDGEMASVGVTTVFDALRVGSIVSDGRSDYSKYAREVCSEILSLRACHALKISHRIHLRAEICSETLTQELAEFGPEDRIGILSLMDHTPGQRQFRELDALRKYTRGKYGMNEEQFQAHVRHLQSLQDRYGALHEAAAVSEAQRLGAMLASHDDTTSADVQRSAAHGLRLAEFPTTTEAAEVCHQHNIAVMMGAPNLMRGGSHSGNVAASDLAERGLLDILSSDYIPSALLAAAMKLAMQWQDLPRAMATVTQAPAVAAGLTDRGELVTGKKADVLRFRLHGEFPVVRGVWVHGRRVA